MSALQQLEFFDIPSPCIGVCQAGPKGYCMGCYRTREERLYWMQLGPDVKRKIVKACAQRKRRALKGTVQAVEVPAPEQGELFND